MPHWLLSLASNKDRRNKIIPMVTIYKTLILSHNLKCFSPKLPTIKNLKHLGHTEHRQHEKVDTKCSSGIPTPQCYEHIVWSVHVCVCVSILEHVPRKDANCSVLIMLCLIPSRQGRSH